MQTSYVVFHALQGHYIPQPGNFKSHVLVQVGIDNGPATGYADCAGRRIRLGWGVL